MSLVIQLSQHSYIKFVGWNHLDHICVLIGKIWDTKYFLHGNQVSKDTAEIFNDSH